MKKNLDKSFPINIAIVGGGRRVSLFYIELCTHFESIGLVNVVGISNRTLSKVQDFSKHFNCNLYETVEELIECEDVDAAILSVSSEVKDNIAMFLVRSGVHLFLDSPVTNNIFFLRKLIKQAFIRKVRIEVAEDQSFSPEAQLQREILASGIFGKLQIVDNRNKEIDYHAIARLRNIGVSLGDKFLASSFSYKINEKVTVSCQTVKFNTVLYLSKYISPKKTLIKSERDFVLVCEKGVITSNYAEHDAYGRIFFQKKPQCDDGAPQSSINMLSVKLGEDEFKWSSGALPKEWSRKHHGLHRLLDTWINGITNQGLLSYGVQSSIQDLKILTSLRISKRTRIPIPSFIVNIL
jgi:hypothetical protein